MEITDKHHICKLFGYREVKSLFMKIKKKAWAVMRAINFSKLVNLKMSRRANEVRWWMDGWMKTIHSDQFLILRDKYWIQYDCLNTNMPAHTLSHALQQRFEEWGLAYSNTVWASPYFVYCTEWGPSIRQILKLFSKVEPNYTRRQRRILKVSGGVKDDGGKTAYHWNSSW